ncbi:N-alpha-acetyltransferase 35 NatC auxiliary subunit [Blomia tropicalis]|nr:N-alpha-acetyltransferase 35 NatC auxiliary subunit [Blomia tropicalis]
MDIVKNYNTYLNWVDITEDFINASNELKLGELVHDDLFGLFDAMAAIELMDPKMDAGMVCNKSKKIFSFDEMIDMETIKIDSFTPAELIGIIDDTFSCMVTWFDGHSLAQTVFINLYLHNPNRITCKRLKSFAIVILKIVDMINDFVQQALVYEEEDFQPKTYNFNLASSVSFSKASTMIKVVEDDLTKLIAENTTEKNEWKALLVRYNFTKQLFVLLNNYKKQISNNPTSVQTLKEFLLTINQCLSSCEELLKQWSDTIEFGIKPLVNDNVVVDHCKPDYPTILGFQPLINQRLLPPSFPRYTKIKSRSDTVNYLRIKLTPSCVVSRSMLQLFYLPQTGLIFGETLFLKIVKESCKQFIKPPVLCNNINLDSGTKDIVDAFFNRCLVPFKNIIQTYGHNRARQREKIAVDFVVIIEESITLDRYLSNKLNQNFIGFLQFWLLYYKLCFMSQYLLSGFELELYSLHEYSYMYMELEYIWDYTTLLLKRVAEMYLQSENSTNGTNCGKNNRKKHTKSKNRNQQLNFHEQEIMYYKGICLLAGAFHRIFLAFTIENKITQPEQNLNTERIRYNHRFLPLARFEGGLLSYDKYKERYDLFDKKSATKQLYIEAGQLLSQGRMQFECVKEPSLQDEIQTYVKVAKTNTIVINLLLSGHNTMAKPDLIFTDCTHFPIIKFAKS